MPVVFLGKSRERVCVTDLRTRTQSKWSSPGTGWGERGRLLLWKGEIRGRASGESWRHGFPLTIGREGVSPFNVILRGQGDLN